MRDDIIGYKMYCGVFLFALDFVWLGLLVQFAFCLIWFCQLCSFIFLTHHCMSVWYRCNLYSKCMESHLTLGGV